MGLKVVMLAVAFAVPVGSHAVAGRLHCVVDDAAIRMVIESAHGKSIGQRLTQLRGVMAVKEEGGPPPLRKVTFSSGMLRQGQFGENSLQMTIGSERRNGLGFGSFDLVLEAAAPDAASSRLEGRYSLSANWRQGQDVTQNESAQYAGTVSCTYE